MHYTDLQHPGRGPAREGLRPFNALTDRFFSWHHSLLVTYGPFVIYPQY